jgi:transcriptional regulator with XRE-family HTH domain
MTKLHVLLEQMEYTERSFAKEIGCSRTLVNLWAHGQKPSDRFLPKVCDVWENRENDRKSDDRSSTRYRGVNRGGVYNAYFESRKKSAA